MDPSGELVDISVYYSKKRKGEHELKELVSSVNNGHSDIRVLEVVIEVP